MKRDKSKLTDDLTKCFICSKPANAIHEVFFGTANRKKSIEDGMYLGLCNEHHNMSPYSVHNFRETDLLLKTYAQRKWEENGTREEFIKRYGKSWL